MARFLLSASVRSGFALALAFLILVPWAQAQAQTQSQSQTRRQTQAATSLDEINQGRLTILTSGVADPADPSIAAIADLARLFDRPGRLRIVPALGYGQLANVRDVLRLRGIDMGVVNADVLRFLAIERQFARAKRDLRLVTPLYENTLLVVTRNAVPDLAALAGRVLVTPGLDSPEHIAARTLFSLLGIEVAIEHRQDRNPLDQVADGRADATLMVAGDLAGALEAVVRRPGLRILPVPSSDAVAEVYRPVWIAPPAVAGGLDTVSVATLLVSFNWKTDSARYQPVRTLVDTMFRRFEDLRGPNRHPIWRTFDPDAAVPDWQPLDRVAELLASTRADRERIDARRVPPAGSPVRRPDADREAPVSSGTPVAVPLVPPVPSSVETPVAVLPPATPASPAPLAGEVAPTSAAASTDAATSGGSTSSAPTSVAPASGATVLARTSGSAPATTPAAVAAATPGDNGEEGASLAPGLGLRLAAVAVDQFADEALPNGGVAVELLRTALDEATPEGEGAAIASLDWVGDGETTLVERLAADEFDVMLPVVLPNCERPGEITLRSALACDHYRFSAPIMQTLLVLFARNAVEIDLSNGDELVGKRVCVPDDQDVSPLRDFVEDRGISLASVILERRASPAACLTLLAEGSADLMMTNDRIGQAAVEAAGLQERVRLLETPIGVITLHAAVLRANPDAQTILSRLNGALEELRQSRAFSMIIERQIVGN